MFFSFFLLFIACLKTKSAKSISVPVFFEKEKKDFPQNKTKIFYIILILAIVLAIIVFFVVKSFLKKQKEDEYLKEIAYEINAKMCFFGADEVIAKINDEICELKEEIEKKTGLEEEKKKEKLESLGKILKDLENLKSKIDIVKKEMELAKSIQDNLKKTTYSQAEIKEKKKELLLSFKKAAMGAVEVINEAQNLLKKFVEIKVEMLN